MNATAQSAPCASKRKSVTKKAWNADNVNFWLQKLIKFLGFRKRLLKNFYSNAIIFAKAKTKNWSTMIISNTRGSNAPRLSINASFRIVNVLWIMNAWTYTFLSLNVHSVCSLLPVASMMKHMSSCKSMCASKDMSEKNSRKRFVPLREVLLRRKNKLNHRFHFQIGF